MPISAETGQYSAMLSIVDVNTELNVPGIIEEGYRRLMHLFSSHEQFIYQIDKPGYSITVMRPKQPLVNPRLTGFKFQTKMADRRFTTTKDESKRRSIPVRIATTQENAAFDNSAKAKPFNVPRNTVTPKIALKDAKMKKQEDKVRHVSPASKTHKKRINKKKGKKNKRK